MKSEIHIIKASGQTALFSEEKLRNSLRRAGAYEEIIEEVVSDIQGQLKDGMTTKKIYQLAFRILRRKNKPAASKYKLKKAIMELGPSGFPFEKYISEILKTSGHSIQLNLIMKGHCVNHEVDILATKEGVQKIIECKYHNFQGTISDVKIPLYVHSRFRDIIENIPTNNNYEGWIVTNTRFSPDAMQYARCSSLHLWGWDYPEGEGLRESIDRTGLYPITCLTTLTQKEKVKLMEGGVVLCREITFSKKLLKEIGVPVERHQGIVEEASGLSEQATQKTVE
jgi:hypothetical protein